ncbi:MAG: response regulator [Candidatus Schekmanbacteria bacterium]|nr:response regulator [Candidatus Schekmanbacteria bacterium]
MNNSVIKILLIEDNPGDVRLIEEMLTESKSSGFALESTDRLSAGLNLLEKKRFDIVLLDLGLPDSQGIYAVLRIIESFPAMPVIVLTGLSDEVVGLEAISKGAQDYLVKGHIESNLLVRSLRYSLERKRIEEEKEKLIKDLRDALGKIKTLSGMLPICASCKKIRDDKGYWNQIESYLRDHSEAEFSHGICPECAEKFYPDYYKGEKK